MKNSNWFWAGATLAAALWGFAGCASPRVASNPEAETVGTLTPSYHSISTAPVHADTDLTPKFDVVGTDDASATVEAVPEELPEVTAKGNTLKMGAAR
jgi:hypothetical protein